MIYTKLTKKLTDRKLYICETVRCRQILFLRKDHFALFLILGKSADESHMHIWGVPDCHLGGILSFGGGGICGVKTHLGGFGVCSHHAFGKHSLPCLETGVPGNWGVEKLRPLTPVVVIVLRFVGVSFILKY